MITAQPSCKPPECYEVDQERFNAPITFVVLFSDPAGGHKNNVSEKVKSAAMSFEAMSFEVHEAARRAVPML